MWILSLASLPKNVLNLPVAWTNFCKGKTATRLLRRKVHIFGRVGLVEDVRDTTVMAMKHLDGKSVVAGGSSRQRHC